MCEWLRREYWKYGGGLAKCTHNTSTAVPSTTIQYPAPQNSSCRQRVGPGGGYGRGGGVANLVATLVYSLDMATANTGVVLSAAVRISCLLHQDSYVTNRANLYGSESVLQDQFIHTLHYCLVLKCAHLQVNCPFLIQTPMWFDGRDCKRDFCSDLVLPISFIIVLKLICTHICILFYWVSKLLVLS